ncbi:unnamed protein product [Hymenolepis diminuta]|nr:unnamed protein product [Hymenolepis diminuta]
MSTLNYSEFTNQNEMATDWASSAFTLIDIAKNLQENEPSDYFLTSFAEDPVATHAFMSDETTNDIIFDKLLALLEGVDIMHFYWTVGFVMENLHRKQIQN